MHVLVTGGAGFIGSHLVEALLARGIAVRVLSREAAPNNLQAVLHHPMLDIAVGDVMEGIDWEQATEGAEAVFHCQWGTLPRRSHQFLSRDLENTLLLGLQMLDGAVKSGVKKIIFPSSGGTIYGATDEETLSEEHPQTPVSSYGLTKLTFEKYLHLYQYEYGIDYTVFRISNAYGPRQNLHRPQGVISHWLNQILQSGRIEVWGDGTVVRDYLYISDVIKGMLSALGENAQNQIYNLGSGIGISLNEIIERMQSVLGLKFDVTYKSQYHSDVPHNVLDIEKAKRELAWAPSVAMEEGLRNCFDYIKNRHV
ncbi:MAG: NAD-dependent epimerase/dehydratase family protein [Haliscomenobacter sp.]|nr:NAD-dependent epimerase/dehydratase family protein [Haliscomenobacter sp.]